MMTHSSTSSARGAWGEWVHHPAVGRMADSAGQTGWALVLLVFGGVLHAFELVLAFVRGVVKAAMCLAAGIGAGLVTVGVFALREPALWEYGVLRRSGPPIGPVALGAGVALLTAQFLLIAFFFRSWRRAPGWTESR